MNGSRCSHRLTTRRLRSVAVVGVLAALVAACGAPPSREGLRAATSLSVAPAAGQAPEIVPVHIGAAPGGPSVSSPLAPDGTSLELSCSTSDGATLTLLTTGANPTYVSQGLVTVPGASAIPILPPPGGTALGGSLLTLVDEATSGWVMYQVSGTVALDGPQCGAQLQVTEQAVAVQTAVTVTDMSPELLGRPSTNVPVTISGSNFVSGTVLTASGQGVTFRSAKVISPFTMTATATVAAGAALGSHDLVATPPGGSAVRCAGCITVEAIPTVRSVGVLQTNGVDVPIKVLGNGFPGDTFVTIGGTGVRLVSTKVVRGTTLLLTVTAVRATPASYDVTVSNRDGLTSTCTGCLKVVPGPTLTNITPDSVPREASTSVTLTGTLFSPGARVMAGYEVRVSGTTVSSDGTTITATLVVGKQTTGGRLTVVNPASDGGGMVSLPYSVTQ